jgi:NADP-dependent 3-hydroxy acid dehydrogenase YdfG
MAFTNGLRQELAGTPIRVIGIYPPIIDPISPLDPAWEAAPERPKAAMISTRDVVDAVLFAVTRPRSCSITSLVLDSDHGGIYSD